MACAHGVGMTTENAKNKLIRNGFLIAESSGSYNSRIIASKAGVRCDILICTQGGDVATIRTKPHSDEDDMQSDYTAGSFWNSLSQALRQAV